MFQHTKPRYTVTDGMNLLGCGRARLYEYIKNGVLESYKVKGRRYLSPEGIDKVVEFEKSEAMEA